MARPEQEPDDAPAADETPPVSVHRTNPERVVFTEDGNRDGWLASDLVVSVDR
jgi:hypothetical protein